MAKNYRIREQSHGVQEARDEAEINYGNSEVRERLAVHLRGSLKARNFIRILAREADVVSIKEKSGVTVVKAPNGKTAHVSNGGELSPNYMKQVAFGTLRL
jgi:hypothetical protein